MESDSSQLQSSFLRTKLWTSSQETYSSLLFRLFPQLERTRFWCHVRALKWYPKKTSPLCQSDRLFILPRSPFSAASKDTICKWITRLITQHATQGSKPRAHDVIGQATSMALFKGVPIQDILKAAAWKTPSTFVSCYLTDILTSDTAFGHAVLKGPSREPHAANRPPL